MKIMSEKLEEIRKRVEDMAIENDYSRKNLELDLVCIYVRELEAKLETEKEISRLFKESYHKLYKSIMDR